MPVTEIKAYPEFEKLPTGAQIEYLSKIEDGYKELVTLSIKPCEHLCSLPPEEVTECFSHFEAYGKVNELLQDISNSDLDQSVKDLAEKLSGEIVEEYCNQVIEQSTELSLFRKRFEH